MAGHSLSQQPTTNGSRVSLLPRRCGEGPGPRPALRSRLCAPSPGCHPPRPGGDPLQRAKAQGDSGGTARPPGRCLCAPQFSPSNTPTPQEWPANVGPVLLPSLWDDVRLLADHIRAECPARVLLGLRRGASMCVCLMPN